jgi:membrane protein DedA with SNARE-associated domain
MVIESLALLKNLIVNFSYLGVFLISIASSSTIFLPFPIYIIIFAAAGLGLNLLVTGIVAGIGSALGELTGYFIGMGGRYIAEEKEKNSKLKVFTKLFKKYGFPVIVFTAFIPFPFDIIGIASGIAKYNLKYFLIATCIGKIAKCLLITYVGYLAIPFIRTIFK